MSRSLFINMLSAAGLITASLSLTPSGWNAEPSTTLLTLALFIPVFTLVVVLFVLAKIDLVVWGMFVFFTNLAVVSITLASTVAGDLL